MRVQELPLGPSVRSVGEQDSELLYAKDQWMQVYLKNTALRIRLDTCIQSYASVPVRKDLKKHKF
jgi:hypothetical protein